MSLEQLKSSLSDALLLKTQLSTNISYSTMMDTKKGHVESLAVRLQQRNLYSKEIQEEFESYKRESIESYMNTLRRASSCPEGYLTVVFCSCGYVNRSCYVNCPECGNRHFTSCGSPSCGANDGLSKQCFHIGRAVCRDYLSFSFYPVWNGLLDLFATDNDVYMHNLTRLQWVNNIAYDLSLIHI